MQQNNQANNNEQLPRTFNPREHLIQLKSREGSKDYLPVQWRLVWFREQCPQGTIETEIVHLDLDRETEEETFVWNSEKRRSEKAVKTARGIAIVRAVVRDGKGGVATGTKMEKAASFSDWLEKAETGAIGRALAALGYGTSFAPDLDEEHRIVDAPVDRTPVAANGNGAPRDENAEGSVTEQQVASIKKLCQHIDGESEPDALTDYSFAAAKTLIQRLSAKYKETRQNNGNNRAPANSK